MNTQTDDATSTPPAVALSNETRKRLLWRRRLYLALVLIMLGLSVAGSVTKQPLYLLFRLPVAAIFIFVFLGVARDVMGYHAWKLVLIGIAVVVVPFAGMIVLATVDRSIYERLCVTASANPANPGVVPAATPWTYVALLTCWIPVVGLVLSIITLTRIRRSAGALRGRGLAVFALVASILFTVMIGGAFLSIIIDAV